MDKKELFTTVVLISILAVLILLCGLVVMLSLCELGDLMSSHNILAYKIGIVIGQVFKVLGIIWVINYVTDKTRKHIRLIRV